MQLIQKLKNYAKDAIKAGKVIRRECENAAWIRPLDEFASSLNEHEWMEFEKQERAFRQSLSSRGVFYDKFICKGGFSKWKRVLIVITGIFVKGGEFQQQNFNGKPWSLNLCVLFTYFEIITKGTVPW